MHDMNATDTDANQVKCFTEYERIAEKILQKTNKQKKPTNSKKTLKDKTQSKTNQNRSRRRGAATL